MRARWRVHDAAALTDPADPGLGLGLDVRSIDSGLVLGLEVRSTHVGITIGLPIDFRHCFSWLDNEGNSLEHFFLLNIRKVHFFKCNLSF